MTQSAKSNKNYFSFIYLVLTDDTNWVNINQLLIPRLFPGFLFSWFFFIYNSTLWELSEQLVYEMTVLLTIHHQPIEIYRYLLPGFSTLTLLNDPVQNIWKYIEIEIYQYFLSPLIPNYWSNYLIIVGIRWSKAIQHSTKI